MKSLRMFIQDEDGNITKSDVVKVGAVIALGLAPGVAAQSTPQQCTCNPGCGSCHANTLGNQETCGTGCHVVINGNCPAGGGK